MIINIKYYLGYLIFINIDDMEFVILESYNRYISFVDK